MYSSFPNGFEVESHLLSIMLESVDISSACSLLGIIPTAHIPVPQQGHIIRATPWQIMSLGRSLIVSLGNWPPHLDPTPDLAVPRTFSNLVPLANFGGPFKLDMFPNIFTLYVIPNIKPQRYTTGSFSAFIAFFQELNVNLDLFVSQLIQKTETDPETADIH